MIDDIINNNRCNVVNMDNMSVIKDVIYDQSNPQLLTADLFMPQTSEGKLRVLINIHGGGWVSGDKKWRISFSSLMCGGKHFVMNINYGLSPEYKYPYCIANVFSALRFIYDNAEQYNLDLDNIYLSGDSAGAQIASVVAALLNLPDDLAILNLQPVAITIRGLILFCGAYDMANVLMQPLSFNMAEDITGYHYKNLSNFDKLRYMSTAELVSPQFPPSLVVTAKLDSIVPKHEKRFIKALEDNNVPYYHFISKRLISSAHCFHLYHTAKDSVESINLAKQHLDGKLI